MKGHSPVKKKEKEFFGFNMAIAKIMEGKKVTRMEWGDVRWYCTLSGGLLAIHKSGEAYEQFRAWIVNDGDIKAVDWYVIE